MEKLTWVMRLQSFASRGSQYPSWLMQSSLLFRHGIATVYKDQEGGVPNTLAAQRNHITPFSSNIVPSTQHMVGIHEENGLHLQRDASYGTDPLCGNIQLQQLRERFFCCLPRFGYCSSMDRGKVSINHFLSLTNQFSLLLS